jgi:glycosyltransferase involved in cell wall biosynthesis
LPKVSVITAAYNHARFIRQCLESVQHQTFRDFEHIVVDDGSSDGTAEILQAFGRGITYISQQNCGAHGAINRAIRASAGDYIALLDSDDAWLPNKLERQIAETEKVPEAGLIYSLAYVIDGEGNLSQNQKPIGKPFSSSEHAYQDLLRDNHIPALTAVFKRAYLEEVGYFNESLPALSDWDLWLRLANRWPVLFVPEPLALYRVHGKNTWDLLVSNGQADRERLLLLKNAYLTQTANDSETKRRRALIDSAFRELALKTAYGLWYRHQYSAAKAYLALAIRLRPRLLKDGILALRPRFVPRLLVGERGTKLFRVSD